ncbi:hypothetical protein INR49_013781 [Caranx melampygus]|nr:hypothetical protein INR49_013781 [Caranx melampygus]
MPLHGKIVVIKRSGGDGTEFPLTATCLFGRKPDCDIRIQLPQVSKEHCRIDLNENKEVILTNLSSVNPTRVNGEALQQSERLKHGDVITIIDRSFRFEYPPAPTPKKRSSAGGKSETLKVLQAQQVVEAVKAETGEKRISEDGANDNIQRSLEKTMELECKEDGIQQNKTISPFNDLYQMIKKSLDVKTPRKSSARPAAEEAQQPATSEATPQKRNRASPQRFTAGQVIEQVCAQKSKSPTRRRSKEATPARASVKKEQEEQAIASPKTKASPRSLGKPEKEVSKKRKSGELGVDLPTSQMKKKRVSFGGYLSPELFDKRLPPDSPLRKGATPRRSLCLSKPKYSLLRRASVIGLLTECEQDVQRSPAKKKTPSPKKSSSVKNASPKTPPSGKKLPKSRSPSPKAASPAKKSPKSKSPSPKAASPGKKSPKSKSPSTKAASPGAKSPKPRTPSPKAASPAEKSLKSKTPSPARERSPSKSQTKPSTVTPAQTPCNSGVRTSTGRFSVSRISTPSPVAEDSVPDKTPSATVTPKIPLRRKSMKSTSRKTPCVSRSAVKALRRSGISRVSIKVRDTWANTVKFGQAKTQVVVPTKRLVTKKTTKKAVPKPQTPARKLKDYVSTGHADSPVTIVVGRAYNQKVVLPTGAAPRVVTNTALLKKNLKMDEDLTGISEMFKTPANERRRKSVISSATETPVGVLATSVIEPSVLNTPEEPGEMMVSPLSVASAMKDGRYSSEAVQRLLNEDQESSFVDEIPAFEMHSESTEPQCTGVKATPKQKPEVPECLTGVKRIMKTPRQKAEPVEDLRGKILKTPKQKVEQQECLTGVKRIMRTPRQKAEPIEDIRGKVMATPKQKPVQQECLTGVRKIFETPKQEARELQEKCLETPRALEAGDVHLDGVTELQKTPAHMQESEDSSKMTDMKTPKVKISPLMCLTGVKRIMKTPKEKSAPVEDMVGVKRLMRTPKERAEPVEKNFGIKALMKSPRLRGNAAVEDFEGLRELMEEPLTDSSGPMKMDEVEDQTLPDCAVDMTKELDVAQGEPQEDTPSNVIDVPEVDLAKEEDANEALIHNHVEEVPCGNNESSDAMEMSQAAVDESLPKEQPKVHSLDEKLSEEQQEVETATVKVTQVNTTAEAPDHEKKSVRGQKARTWQLRKNKRQQSRDPKILLHQLQSGEEEGRKLKPQLHPPLDKQEINIMMVTLQWKKGLLIDVNDESNDSTAAPEKAASKPKRGRKTKQATEPSKSVPDVPCDNVPQADGAKDADEVCSNELEVVTNETESLPAVDTEVCKVTATDVAVVQEKSARGRRAKVVKPKAAEDKEATDGSEDPVVPAPVRGRRGKKAEATAPPAVRQTTRTRNAKSQENTSDDKPEVLPEKPVEEQPVTEVVSDESSLKNTSQDENDSATPVEEAFVKPTRGRKTKQPPVEAPQPKTEKNEVVSEEQPMVDPQPQESFPTAGKPRRGRKTKMDIVEHNAAEDAVVTEETKLPPVRAKRGRNAKQEEKQENGGVTTSDETSKSQEPVKKSRRTRKAEQDVEPREETTEMVVAEVTEALPADEPLKMDEQVSVAAKPRRGGRKAKQDTQGETPLEPTEVKEVPAVSATEKPKRGRRGQQVAEEVDVTAEVTEAKPDQELEAEEKKTTEPDVPVIKPSRGRGVKTVKNEVSNVIPAKRARRGATLPVEETNPEPTVLVSESVSTAVEPPKRGRRAVAPPKQSKDGSAVSCEQANPSEDLNNDAVEDTKVSKRSVKWKAELEEVQVVKATPVKAVRGRKTKAEKGVSKPEEKDLSDEVVEAQPIKRARRGAKVTDDVESSSKVDLQKSAEAETQPKTRRGRSAKK